MTDTACICIAVRKAGRRLTTIYDAALAAEGITLAQFSLLRNIRRHAPMSLTRLADIVDLDRSTLGRNVRLLERMGLVLVGSGPDQRQTPVTLTAAGTETLDRSAPLWQAAQADIHRKIGTQGAVQLAALLGAL